MILLVYPEKKKKPLDQGGQKKSGKVRSAFLREGNAFLREGNRGVAKPGVPIFSGKVRIVSRTLSGLFLV